MSHLQRGFEHHKKGEYAAAKAQYLLQLKLQANDFNAMQLLGMLAHAEQDYLLAIQWMLKSLSLNERQPNVCSNLGNSYKKLDDLTSAARYYRKAISLQANYKEAWQNLFMCLIKQGDYKTVVLHYKDITRLSLENARLYRYFGIAFRELDQHDDSDKAFKRALSLEQSDTATLLEYGVLLFKTGHYNDALTHYQAAQAVQHDHAILHNMGNAYHAIGDSQRAIDAYRSALNLEANYPQTYRNLAELLFEQGQVSQMFAHYNSAFTNGLSNIDIGLDFIKLQMRVSNISQAATALKQMHAWFPNNQNLHVLEGQLALQQGNPEAAFKLHYLIDLNTCGVDNLLIIAETALQANQLTHAKDAIETALKLESDNQHALCLWYTFQRLTKRSATIDEPIIDAENYVFEHTISPPHGYSLSDYCAKLSDYLRQLHQSKLQPLEQTLQGGTQTVGNLFDNDHPLLKHLVSEFDKAINHIHAQIMAVESVNGQRLYPGFEVLQAHKYAGSWSVLLKQSGFHSNHYHPMGWLSSAFYVALPDEIGQKKKDDIQGWLKVGEPNFKTTPMLEPTKVIKPEVGKLVIFPSFLWHGTVPFDSFSERISVAFDIKKSKSCS